MTRTITPAEIKVGMEIEWIHSSGFKCAGVVSSFEKALNGGAFVLGKDCCVNIVILGDTAVTVLKEAPPEEPAAFGAIVRVTGKRYVRLGGAQKMFPWTLEQSSDDWSWGELLERGTPEILVADPLANTVPDVPDRIEEGEWPEDDEHLRSHRWRDVRSAVWSHHGDGWYWDIQRGFSSKYAKPVDGPWERVVP